MQWDDIAFETGKLVVPRHINRVCKGFERPLVYLRGCHGVFRQPEFELEPRLEEGEIGGSLHIFKARNLSITHGLICIQV